MPLLAIVRLYQVDHMGVWVSFWLMLKGTKPLGHVQDMKTVIRTNQDPLENRQTCPQKTRGLYSNHPLSKAFAVRFGERKGYCGDMLLQ